MIKDVTLGNVLTLCDFSFYLEPLFEPEITRDNYVDWKIAGGPEIFQLRIFESPDFWRFRISGPPEILQALWKAENLSP